jgi:hypothetical protein
VTWGTQHVLRVAVSVAVTVALTALLWPLIQGKSVTALAVAGGVATSSLLEDRIAHHELHWGGAIIAATVCGMVCYAGLWWLAE